MTPADQLIPHWPRQPRRCHSLSAALRFLPDADESSSLLNLNLPAATLAFNRPGSPTSGQCSMLILQRSMASSASSNPKPRWQTAWKRFA